MANADAIEGRTTLPRGREGGEGGAILFDPVRLRQAEPDWFDPAWWGRRARPVDAGGRGGAWFVDAPFGDAVLRRYRRGGMAARVSRDGYLWQGERRVRSFAEFRLTEALWREGLPVPRPIAAQYLRQSMRYRAAILVERLHDVRTFGALAAEQGPRAPWEQAGALVARFHRAGLDHADLNAHNLLFDAAGNGWLIDLDRGKRRRPGATWRRNNLARLLRSLQKLRGARGRGEVDGDFARLRAAYDAAFGGSP